MWNDNHNSLSPENQLKDDLKRLVNQWICWNETPNQMAGVGRIVPQDGTHCFSYVNCMPSVYCCFIYMNCMLSVYYLSVCICSLLIKRSLIVELLRGFKIFLLLVISVLLSQR